MAADITTPLRGVAVPPGGSDRLDTTLAESQNCSFPVTTVGAENVAVRGLPALACVVAASIAAKMLDEATWK